MNIGRTPAAHAVRDSLHYLGRSFIVAVDGRRPLRCPTTPLLEQTTRVQAVIAAYDTGLVEPRPE
jgi:hypothetical protein